jgi:iron donor protein CyaY
MDIESLERVVALDPKNPSALLDLGLALIAAGRAADALDPLRHALILRRDYCEAYLALGQALLDEGEQVAAIATLEGGREMARKSADPALLERFEAALAGHGPVKRRGTALDESAFSEVARGTLATIADRVTATGLDVGIQRSPGIVILDVARRAKLGLSEQKSSREIWCSCALGEFKFRYIPSSGHWRTADGDELLQIVSRFISRETGAAVSL